MDIRAQKLAEAEMFVRWAENRPDVRALVLTSSLTAPHVPVDKLSDHDIVIAVTDAQAYFDDDGWLSDFGEVLVVYSDPVMRSPEGWRFRGYVTQYAQHKIDFTIMDAPMLAGIAAQRPLAPDYDLGYVVLLDRDGLTAEMPAPTYQAFILKPPTAEEFRYQVEMFFHEGTYAIKNLWRGDLIAARFFIDGALRFEHLIPMLWWWLEIRHDWRLKTGIYGRGMIFRLPPELRAALDATYAGPGLEAAWAAFNAEIELFARVSREVAAALGYAYPEDFHARMMAYFEWVKELEP